MDKAKVLSITENLSVKKTLFRRNFTSPLYDLPSLTIVGVSSLFGYGGKEGRLIVVELNFLSAAASSASASASSASAAAVTVLLLMLAVLLYQIPRRKTK
ncbi:hypothetical protein MLD38_020022 [Melastoma candidum]|uniref:Uncharacterized protein n=1 Tax=Melastoma candidum TaxID=119954 RepID=A0ACB9QC10_9MYRT|nr:hypothetical protein MLD38_020022 [Melastoma candidum]